MRANLWPWPKPWELTAGWSPARPHSQVTEAWESAQLLVGAGRVGLVHAPLQLEEGPEAGGDRTRGPLSRTTLPRGKRNPERPSNPHPKEGPLRAEC